MVMTMSEEVVKYEHSVELTEEDIQESAIVQLKPRHQRFVHMWLSGNYKVPQIASILQVSEHTVRSWLKHPRIKSVIQEYQRDEEEIVLQNMKAMRMKALDTMYDLMDSEQDAIKYQAAKDILDRNGFKPSQKQDVKIEVYNYEKEIKKIMGTNFVEAEYTVGDEDNE